MKTSGRHQYILQISDLPVYERRHFLDYISVIVYIAGVKGGGGGLRAVSLFVNRSAMFVERSFSKTVYDYFLCNNHDAT